MTGSDPGAYGDSWADVHDDWFANLADTTPAVAVLAAGRTTSMRAELDLMARLAGLTPTNRWSGWERHPVTSTSTGHVSTYRKPTR